jgi:hypothetical protein
MRPGAYDRCLITLAWLAPLALLVLNRWQMALDTWYVPLNGSAIGEIHTAFAREAQPWLDTLTGSNGKLYLVVDPACPCTKPAIERIGAALRQSGRADIALTVVALADPAWTSNPHWRSVLRNLPATPSAIAVEGQQLKYAGPAISGSLCSTAGKAVVVNALQGASTATGINLIDRGCYCPVNLG